MKKDTLLGVFKSKGRLNKEANSKYRSPFQRDRDRIIHSASFRRLKHKTQVFVNTEGDHFRTRITHSIEVAQIARSIAKYLNLNEDLTETLSLAHDLGHTPFGHAGEDAYNVKSFEDDALYRLEIRKKFREMLNLGFSDVYRHFNEDKEGYTFWDYMRGAWQKNNGMRIDHFLVSNSLIDLVKDININKDPRGREKPSDHTPIEIKLA